MQPEMYCINIFQFNLSTADASLMRSDSQNSSENL